ncbi:MAG: ABC transporter ATP-binding protein, partial [Oscillospiraceae bacterium]|nr:ABC transporter ATP-binding protein [Oscillospiraceae bacterium]
CALQGVHIPGSMAEVGLPGAVGQDKAKTLVIEDQSIHSFRELTGEMNRSAVRAARLNAVYIPVTLFFSTLTVAIVLLRGGWLVEEQVLEIATLSAFITYAMNIFEPIQNLTANLAEFIAVQASIERVTGLLDERPQVTDTPQVVEKYGDSFDPKRENWEPLKGEIEFRDVTFRYPDGGDNVLEHFDLKIPAGTTVAIVGETGAGKSTLVNLACRFFEPTQGQILIDGRDYRERSQLWLHSNIGYVLQSPHLFSGSVRENIRYGRLDATDREVEAAARAVSADKVAAKLEQGWDSDVGEEGDRLSTGEKQLISFARAVLADPRIFVLDEATSSIDTQTEQDIQNAIDHLLRDRTSFLIAHRLSTIRKADMILVVRDGKIVERGTHQSLLRAHGYYHDLYSRQFAEENAAKVLGA